MKGRCAETCLKCRIVFTFSQENKTEFILNSCFV